MSTNHQRVDNSAVDEMYRLILAIEGGRATVEQYESLFGESVKEKLLSQAFESPIHALIFLSNSITTKFAHIADEARNRADEARNRADNLSLLRSISLDNEHFKLRFVKSVSSQTKARHIDAIVTTGTFILCPVVKSLQTMTEINGEKGAKTFTQILGEVPGGCLARSSPNSKALEIASKGDIHAAVYTILQDAVCMCNILLEKDKNSPGLNIRKEASLLTNQLDHLVVYISGQEMPVLSVEDNLPNEDVRNSGTVTGQVFDQMLETMNFAWKNSTFGIWTSIEQTTVVWVGAEANKIVEKTDFFLRIV